MSTKPEFAGWLLPDNAALLETGARVTSVNEEGDVALFCYSLARTFSFTVETKDVKAWAARIGDFVTIRVTAEKLEG